MKNNRGHLITRLYLHTKFEVQATFTSWDIMFLQDFQTLTSAGDLKWTMTSMKNNSDNLLTKGYQYTKFEVPATFNAWDTVFTRFSGFDLLWPPMTSDLHEKQ